jgi:hypothetical protein
MFSGIWQRIKCNIYDVKESIGWRTGNRTGMDVQNSFSPHNQLKSMKGGCKTVV